MAMLRLASLVLASIFLLVATTADAHYHILLPESASAQRGKPVAFVVQFGHPFEHELFDAAKPERLLALLPDGKIVDLAKTLEQGRVKTGDKKDVAVHRFRFTPDARGDFAFVMTMPPIWMEEEQHFLKDTVRVTLHVLAENGWDHSFGKGFELVPMTRPYGLEPGMVFQAQALVDGKPLPRAHVEVERMNPSPPKSLPPDEQITRTVKTDPNGVATCTLTEPGWWCLTARRDGGQRDRDGKMFPVRARSTLWVFVDEKPESKSAK
jgi:cobalt/nickel transport protein